MTTTRHTPTIVRQLSFSKTLADIADQRAKELGLSTPEYIRFLIAQDSRSVPPRREKISEEAEKELFADLIEFMKEEQKNPTRGARSAEELMKMLDQEV
jgi:hypothetical protein